MMWIRIHKKDPPEWILSRRIYPTIIDMKDIAMMTQHNRVASIDSGVVQEVRPVCKLEAIDMPEIDYNRPPGDPSERPPRVFMIACPDGPEEDFIEPEHYDIYNDGHRSKTRGWTPAMHWVVNVKTNPPESMWHNPKIKDADGMTIAMLWVSDVKSNPPEWMRHDPRVTNNVGHTIATTWIMSVNSGFVNGPNRDASHAAISMPEWMRHDPSIRDNAGNTLAMIWIIFVHTNPPEWMRHDPELRDNAGNTLAMIWIRNIREDPPEWTYHDPNIRNKEGFSVKEIWLKFRSVKADMPMWMDHRTSSGIVRAKEIMTELYADIKSKDGGK